jgi:[protein-PII] uridylyltransferase
LLQQLVTATHRVLAGHRPPTPSEDAATRHGPLMDRVRDIRRAQVEVGPGAAGVTPVVVAAPDRPGLFSAIAGVFSLHGVDVRTADVWTSDDGIAVDEFGVARRLGGETNWRRVESDLHAVLTGGLDLERKLADKVNTYAAISRRPTAAQPPRAEVLVDNDTSELETVVEVRAPDGLAVLHRVTSVLARFGLDIRHAKVATLGHEVVDAFYVRRVANGRPAGRLDDPAEAASLRIALLAELDR